MELDPVIAQVLEMGRGQPPLESLSVAEARAAMLQRVELLKPFAPAGIEAIDSAIATAAGPLPIRLYRPGGAHGPLPVMVWLHGGGWVLGAHDSDDPFCRDLCKRSGALVVSVEYRHAPEARFPAAVEDGHEG